MVNDIDNIALPPEPWRICERGIDPARSFLHETLFALGNGYIGLRGTHEDMPGQPGQTLEGSYLNGFHETESIHYPENAYGLARINEFMLNVPNAKPIVPFVDGRRVDAAGGRITAYERSLDFRKGVLERMVEWELGDGKRLRIESRRLVCFERKHVAAIEYRVTALNFAGAVRLEAGIDSAVTNMQAGDDPRVGSAITGPALVAAGREATERGLILSQRTRNSGFLLATGIACTASGVAGILGSDIDDGRCFAATLAQGETLVLHKYIAYASSRDLPEPEVAALVRAELEQAVQDGFAALAAGQESYLADFWSQADVEIEGDDALQQGVRFNQYHLLQSVGRDGKTNIAAKGVTGEGYEGHYFWDTEIYVFPFFLFSKPEIARALLQYRYKGLPKARERARQMSHERGALYPGAPSPARNARPTTRPVPPSTTSMPTWPIRSACTCWRPATSTSSRNTAPRSCWKRRASGRASAATTAQGASASMR